MVLGKRSAKPVRPDLCEDRVGIHQNAVPAILKLGDPVDVAQIEVNVALATTIAKLLASQAVRRPVLRKITPIAPQPETLEDRPHIRYAVARVAGHRVRGHVIARVRPAEVLEERDLMTETLETYQVLEMVPGVAAHGVPNQMPGTNDFHEPCLAPDARPSFTTTKEPADPSKR